MAKDTENIQLSPAERLRIFELLLGKERTADFKTPAGTVGLNKSKSGTFKLKLKLRHSLRVAEFRFCTDGRLSSSKEYQPNLEVQNFSHISVDMYLSSLKTYQKIPLAA